jgi:hypothetical protein
MKAIWHCSRVHFFQKNFFTCTAFVYTIQSISGPDFIHVWLRHKYR